LIRQLRGEHTLLISSHFLAEISQTCDRLLVIRDGEIVAQGTERELAASLGSGQEIEVTVRGPSARALEVSRGVLGISSVTLLSEDNGETSLRVRASSDIRAQLARTLVLNNLDLLRFDRAASQLESVFMQLSHIPEETVTPAAAKGAAQ
jgi:ABC-2 type transport system ATP-binding protein